MGFQQKLGQLVKSADRDATRLLQRHVRELGRLVETVLRTGRWTDFTAHMGRDLRRAADGAVDAADLSDAVQVIREKVLKAPRGFVEDLRMHGDLLAVQRSIARLFDERRVPRRGFAYVAWSARPERFMYVGKAGNVRRLNLAAHGKLANAAAKVTTLSLVFPAQSTEDALLDVEASLLRLVEHWSGRMPELNARVERVPAGHATKRLARLGDFLAEVAEAVDVIGD